MSFGYGFSLPALTTFGGGGNNPFGQLGPTLDLSFAGTVTDLNDPNGYTLDTNFITPQYQVAAQYAIWETNVGLVSQTFSEIITFTRASTGSFFNSAGVLSSAATNEPRFDYNPSTLAAQGLLIEEARTNLLLQSADFTTTWGTTNVTITANVLASPTGNVDADLVIDTSASTEHYFAQNCSTNTNQAYTQTVYAKAGTAPSFRMMAVAIGSSSTTSDIVFTQTAGVFTASGVAGLITSATATAVGNGWYRCAITYTLNGTVTLHQMRIYPYLSGIYVGTGLGTYFFGAQLEVGSFPTSYIPTTTTALTRAADVASVNTLSPWYNATEGTLYAEVVYLGQLIGAGAETNSISLNDGTSDNRINVRTVRNPTNPQLDVLATTASVTQMDTAGFTPGVVGTTYKRALAYALNSAQHCVDGTLDGATDTSFTVPTGINVLTLPTSVCALYARRITYYPRRLTNADLQTITT
jgi:hypothetical protein